MNQSQSTYTKVAFKHSLNNTYKFWVELELSTFEMVINDLFTKLYSNSHC